ncbi:MAG: hypothetical protein K2W97_01460 [Chthoniobacterales bacterium]|nr:hypothetical protein [Chthoniobacterales bacterium]
MKSFSITLITFILTLHGLVAWPIEEKEPSSEEKYSSGAADSQRQREITEPGPKEANPDGNPRGDSIASIKEGGHENPSEGNQSLRPFMAVTDLFSKENFLITSAARQHDALLDKIRNIDGALEASLHGFISTHRASCYDGKPPLIDVEATLEKWFPLESTWFGLSSKPTESALRTFCKQALQLENKLEERDLELAKQLNKEKTRFCENLLNKLKGPELFKLIAGFLTKKTTITSEVESSPSSSYQDLEEKGKKVILELQEAAESYRTQYLQFVDQPPTVTKQGFNPYLDKFRAIDAVNNTLEHLEQNARILDGVIGKLSFLPQGERAQFDDLLKANRDYAKSLLDQKKYEIGTPEFFQKQREAKMARLDALRQSARLFPRMLRHQAQQVTDPKKQAVLEQAARFTMNVASNFSPFPRINLQHSVLNFLSQIELTNDRRDPLENQCRAALIRVKQGVESKPAIIIETPFKEEWDFPDDVSFDFYRPQLNTHKLLSLSSTYYEEALSKFSKSTPEQEGYLLESNQALNNDPLYYPTKAYFLKTIAESYRRIFPDGCIRGQVLNYYGHFFYQTACTAKEALLVIDSIKAAEQAGNQELASQYKHACHLLYEAAEDFSEPQRVHSDGLSFLKDAHTILDQADQQAQAAGIQVPSRNLEDIVDDLS